jgi:hypothetical protein
MTDRGFLLNRVSQLQARYLDTYGDELSRDEVSRYLSSLIADRQRGELAIFDNLPTGELVATLEALTMREEVANPVELPPENLGDVEVIISSEDVLGIPEGTSSEPEVNLGSEPGSQKKTRGRPKGWRKAK